MKKWCAVTLLLVLSTFSGAQLQSSVKRPCPGESVTFTCKLQSVGHVWHIPSLNITRELLPGSRGGVITDHPPFQFAVTEVVTGSITSTATVNATTNLNGTLIVCRDGIGMELEQRNTINIIGSPSVPTLSCVDISKGVSGAVNVIVNWTLSDGDSADFYLISITTNAPQTPYGGLLNITTGSVTQYELTGFMRGYEYNITVRGVNCGSLRGGESEPLTITLRVPAVPSSCTITLSYDQSSGRLLFINSTWDTVSDQVDLCPDVTGNITQYQIRFQTGSFVVTENINITECTAGRCSHTFEQPLIPPSSYDSVSVAAVNVVGVGAARTCTTQPISTSNNLLTGEVVGVTSPTDARTVCTFLSGFTGSAHCIVQYGTDPTYMNLPYSAESTETGTAGDSVSVLLRERLNSSTVYYYTVSAVSGDISLIVRGTFTTEQYTCNLTELWNLPALAAIFRNDVSLLDDAAQYPNCEDGSVGSVALENTTLNTATVAYYNGTTPGSMACFVCNDGYELNTTEKRFCRRSGLWSGNSVVCECRLPPSTIAMIVLGALAIGATLLGIIVATIDGMIVCYIHFRKQKEKIKQCCSQIRKDIEDDGTNRCWLAMLVIATFFCVIGVALWATVGLIVPNPQNGNACDPSWRRTRDGLIGSAFATSIVAFSFGAAAVWAHVYFHKEDIKKHNKKKEVIALLVIAFILTFFGLGLGITSAVLVLIHYRDKREKQANGSNTDGGKMGQTKEREEVKLKEIKQGISLHDAARQGDLDTVQHLVDNGTNIDIKDENKCTPLHVAAERGNGDIVQHLVGKGADLNIKDATGRAPLHMAAEGGHMEIVRYLVEEKAVISIQEMTGRTPLHVAVEKDHMDTVRCLVEKGANISIQNEAGKTPHDVATERDHNVIVDYLQGFTDAHAQSKTDM